ncbi:MAG TPA: TonB-dependent receptor, partial [Bryobacteraceae bacterium]|nr:TonB-dependent receptor [Bryobacteraceae bacterium]
RFPTQIYDPATTRIVNGQAVRDAFPGNQIPLNRFSTVSRNILGQMPTPTNNGLFNNFTSVGRGATNENQGNIKVDHQFSENNRMSVYFYRDILEGQDPVLLPGPTSPNRASGSRNVWGRVTHDYIFSPSVLNHLTLGYTRFLTSIESYSVDQNWPTQLGLTGVNTGPDNYFPCIDFVSSGYRSLGDQNCNGRVKQTNNNIQVLESLSWVRGSHSMKFGLDYRWMETNGIDNYRSGGVFQFNALETGLPGNPNTGSALASFLLGTVNRGQQAVYGYFPRNRYQYMALYAQDDWKVTDKLTVNYGFRYDVFFPRYEKNGNLSNLDPTLPNPGANGRPGALEFLGEGPGRTGRKSFSDTYWKNFAPRLGLAYQIAPRTVLRSNYGIYYALGNANAGLRDSIQMSNGWITNAVFASTDVGVTPAFNWDQGFPQNFVRPPVIDPAAANGNDLRVVGREDGRPPCFQNWSFTVEQEIVPRVTVEVSYIGTKGSRLGNGLVRLNEVDPAYLSLGSLLTQNINSAAARDANIPIPYPGFTGSVAQALRPFPQYQEILRRSDPSGSSTYHALQTQFMIRTWKGLDVQSAYTWAKTISDSDVLAGGGPGGQTTYNRRLEKAIATTDVPHVFALAYSYELPFGKGRRWMNEGGVANAVLGGWVVTGIHQYSAGTPVQLTANNTLPLFNAVLRPDVVAGADRRNQVENFDPARDLWINPSAFGVPSAFGFGTAARSYTDLRNPSFLNENFGLLKRFALSENARLTFRAEFFNAFNRVVFGGIQANRSNAAFGRVTSQANSPRQGQLALRLDF